MINLKEKLAELTPLLDAEISQILHIEGNRSNNYSPYIAEFIAEIEPLCEGGKRIRGALLYHSYLMFGGKDKPEALKAAAVIELIHTYLLMHDDIIDADNLRRGKETIHYRYQTKHTERSYKGNKELFGTSMGIMAGDVVAHLALQYFTQLQFPAENKLLALERLHSQLVDTAYGEMLDVYTVYRDGIVEDDVIQVHTLKTAIYTYLNPLVVGALLAGADKSELEKLADYAIPAGIAFQIQDDILGMFGDAEKTGKPADSDLKEGKQTLLILKAIEKSTQEEVNQINSALGNNEVEADLVNQVREIIKNSGSLEYSQNLAQNYVAQAVKALDMHSHWDAEGRDFLQSLAEYMIKRDV